MTKHFEQKIPQSSSEGNKKKCGFNTLTVCCKKKIYIQSLEAAVEGLSAYH